MSLWNAFRIVSLLLALAAASVAHAEEGEEGMIGFGQERFQLNLGYYRSNFDTELSAGTKRGPGILPGRIDLENDLGLDSSLGVGRINGHWRFSDRHRLYFGYYKLHREKVRSLRNDIGPIIIPALGINDTILASSNVSSTSSFEVFHLGYGYSFYKSESLELAAKLGLGLGQLKIDVSGTLNTLNNGTLISAAAGASVLVPLPTVGVTLDWAASERWVLKGNAGYFQVRTSGWNAGVADAGVAAEYRLFRNFGIGAGYSLLWIRGDIDRPNYFGELGWKTGGLQLYGTLMF
ncbi:MAG: hypothetical protein GQ467_03110 [Mariprofundaceae bacterium]|nr:hypothetical protein [Mariprofundaceae bacterium]